VKEEQSRRAHTRECKLECCRQVVSGQKRPAQVCREHNLSESVLLRWRRAYEARGEVDFTEKQLSQTEALEREVAELERFCGTLALENEILKKRLARYRSGKGTP
jgi:transposase